MEVVFTAALPHQVAAVAVHVIGFRVGATVDLHGAVVDVERRKGQGGCARTGIQRHRKRLCTDILLALGANEKRQGSVKEGVRSVWW